VHGLPFASYFKANCSRIIYRRREKILLYNKSCEWRGLASSCSWSCFDGPPPFASLLPTIYRARLMLHQNERHTADVRYPSDVAHADIASAAKHTLVRLHDVEEATPAGTPINAFINLVDLDLLVATIVLVDLVLRRPSPTTTGTMCAHSETFLSGHSPVKVHSEAICSPNWSLHMAAESQNHST